MPLDQWGQTIPYTWDPNAYGNARLLYQKYDPYVSPPTEWSFGSAVLDNALGSNPELPEGYTRSEYNREREMAAGQYTSGLGQGTLAVGGTIASTYAIWGSPMRDLATRFAGSASLRHAAPQLARGLIAGARSTGAMTEAFNYGLSMGGRALGKGAGHALGKPLGAALGAGMRGTAGIALRGLGYIAPQTATALTGMLPTYAAAASGGAATVGGGGAAALGAVSGLLPQAALIYASYKASQFVSDVYEGASQRRQIEKDVFEKSNRILRYGNSDESQGLSGGFTEAQRTRLGNLVSNIAAGSAAKSDAFGMGRYSPFGGSSTYAEKMKELKAVLNVGTDMGMFDSAKTFDEFEKKFSSMVQTIEKMSKFMKKSKGEVMALMGDMRQEGFMDVVTAGPNLAKRQFVSQVTGVGLETVMQESQVGANMYQQSGLLPRQGAVSAQNARLMVNRAVRSGTFTDEDIQRMGGAQNIIVQSINADIQQTNDPAFLTEVALMMDKKAGGGYKLNKSGIATTEAAGMSVTGSLNAEMRRKALQERGAYSQVEGRLMEGGELVDRMVEVRRSLARGDLSEAEMLRIKIGLERQTMIKENPAYINATNESVLKRMYMRGGATDEVADMMAKQRAGMFSGMEAEDERQVVKKEQEINRSEFGARETWGRSVAYWTTRALGSLTGMFKGLHGEDPKNVWRDIDKSREDWYVWAMAEPGKEEETRFGHRQATYGESTREQLAGISAKEAMNILSFTETATDPEALAKRKVMAAVSGMEARMNAGVLLAQDKSDVNSSAFAKAAREAGTLYATTDKGWFTDTDNTKKMASFYNWQIGSASGPEGAAIKKAMAETQPLRDKIQRALAGERVAISEAEAKPFGQITGAAYIQAMKSEAGKTEEGKREFQRQHDEMMKNVDYEVGGEVITSETRDILRDFGNTAIKRKKSELLTRQLGIGQDRADVDNFNELAKAGPEVVALAKGVFDAKSLRAIAARGFDAKVGISVNGETVYKDFSEVIYEMEAGKAPKALIDQMRRMGKDKTEIEKMWAAKSPIAGKNKAEYYVAMAAAAGEEADRGKGELIRSRMITQSRAIAAKEGVSTETKALMEANARYIGGDQSALGDVIKYATGANITVIPETESFREAGDKLRKLNEGKMRFGELGGLGFDEVAKKDIAAAQAVEIKKQLAPGNSLSTERRKKLEAELAATTGDTFDAEKLAGMNLTGAAADIAKAKYVEGANILQMTPKSEGKSQGTVDAAKDALKGGNVTNESIDKLWKASIILEKALQALHLS